MDYITHDSPPQRDDQQRRNIGQRFRLARSRNGYTLEQVARRCGLSRNAVAKWESGAAFPIPEHLAVVAELYRVSLDWLVRGQDETSSGDEESLLAAYRAMSLKRQRLLRELLSEYFAD